ncbi:alpha/beta hydrolase [Legionella cardiaca]|uniref:Alpha/beta fold hydrolase n=1 Tax=Legionella cardiaca TaxID=1071983 RepID=A0ABY8AV98_9GAMM|nr:alpha/beta hydrolase [Legionella cardiaca]WED43666.1 alpha/beta fold hydrolase [Legionella cardiaca]
MSKSDYRYMFLATKSKFSNAAFNNKENNSLFQQAIFFALGVYENQKNASSRKIDMVVIREIVKSNRDPEVSRKEIEDYFAGKTTAEKYIKSPPFPPTILENVKGHTFKTGLLDGSLLEDYVTATMNSFYEHILLPIQFEISSLEQKKQALRNCAINALAEARVRGGGQGNYNQISEEIEGINDIVAFANFCKTYTKISPEKNSFESFFKKNLSKIINQNVHFNEYYSQRKITYQLQDFVNFSLERFASEKTEEEIIHSEAMVRAVEEILSDGDSKTQLIKLKNLVAQEGTPNLLHKHMQHAIENYERQQKKYPEGRVVETKVWKNPQDKEKKPEKIIIALHGWRDSAECWNNLGQEAIKKGYQVIAYDHRGYGFDSERTESGHNNELLSIDFRKFLEDIIKENPEAQIELVGHSMGGAILLNNQKFIQNQAQIKSVTCFSPAVTPSFMGFFSEFKNALFKREAHEEALERQQLNQPRFVKPSLSQPGNIIKFLTTLPSLLAIMIEAYKSLRQLATMKPEEGSPKWNIFFGCRDIAVSSDPILRIQEETENRTYLSFEEYPRGDHLLLQGRNATPVLESYFEKIAMKDEISDANKL